MGRYEQSSNGKGSLKLIQTLINEYPYVLNSKLASLDYQEITWVSPIKDDNYAEYRDEAFLERLKINYQITTKLEQFWPKNGPQWDALGRMADNGVLLVEAKANLSELQSSSSNVKSDSSKLLIHQSLEKAKKYIGAEVSTEWSKKYYQYGNRLAHLYFLRVINHIPAHLIFVYFMGDDSVNGPTSQSQWEVAIKKVHKTLGIPDNNPLKKYIFNVFIHANELC